MPAFNVMVTLKRTTEYTVEIEVKAKDEEAAEEKARDKVDKILSAGTEDIVKALDFEHQSEDDDFEYEVSEA